MYAMSYFKLPKGFLNELNMIMAGYWWRGQWFEKKDPLKTMGTFMQIKAGWWFGLSGS